VLPEFFCGGRSGRFGRDEDGVRMNGNGRKRTAIVRDLTRLIAPLDVLYTIGNLIYKRSLRYTMLTAGIGLLGIMAKGLGLPGFTVRQAIMLPLMIGGLSLVCGTLLKVVPSLISSRLLTVAQASDLNLMEDYRKSQVDEHLRALWKRIFQHECRMRMADESPGECGIRPGETGTEAIARARESFFARAKKALISHLPQIQQMHMVGLDLRYLEDWRDGAYLDRSDTKLIEQFDGNATLVAARRAAGMTGLGATMLFRPRRMAQRFWFLFVTRMVAIQVASGVQRLNRQFDTTLFNSQVLLWPGTEDSEWLARHEGAREAVLQRRQRVIRRAFGADFITARDVLDRMLYCCFAASTELRMRYDPDYCDGRVGYDVLGDLETEGRNRRDLQRARAFVREAAAGLERLTAYLQAARPELLSGEDAEALRSVRIAFHTDHDGLKRLLNARGAGTGAEAGEADAEIARIIDRAVARTETYSRRLVAVRMHHELTRLARQGYHELIRQLAYDE
jgi:hypothetical protein